MTLAFWIILILAGCVGMALGLFRRFLVGLFDFLNQAMAGIGWWPE